MTKLSSKLFVSNVKMSSFMRVFFLLTAEVMTLKNNESASLKMNE